MYVRVSVSTCTEYIVHVYLYVSLQRIDQMDLDLSARVSVDFPTHWICRLRGLRDRILKFLVLFKDHKTDQKPPKDVQISLENHLEQLMSH